MGRTRGVGAAEPRRSGATGRGGDGGRLKFRRAACVAACALLPATACIGLTSGESVPVAIVFVQPPDSMHVNDTLVLHVRVLNRAGDSIIGAPLVLVALTPDTLGVDSTRLLVIGKMTGPGQVIARSGSLPSNPLLIPIK